MRLARSSSSGASGPAAGATIFHPGQRVKVNLAGLTAGDVQFSQNVEAVFSTIERQVSVEPPVYRLHLLISFHGVDEVDVPAERIRPM